MQPYFCPYIGYFQLINSVDKFVICDDLQYTKRGWFNRNRILVNGIEKTFTIPLKKDSDFLNSNQRYLAQNSIQERMKILRQIKSSYKKAPFFAENYYIIGRIFTKNLENLFDFIYFSVLELCKNLDIKTEIITSSSINIDQNLKAQARVLDICKFLNADVYINSIGGKELYSQEMFNKEGIELKFIKSKDIKYHQFNLEFVPWLSIIDVLLFNSIEQIKSYLNEYELE